MFSVQAIKLNAAGRQDDLQCCQIFFGKAIFFVSPFMKVHTAVVAAGDSTKEGHTILGCAITSPHHIPTASWGMGSIDSSDGPSRIFTSLICNI